MSNELTLIETIQRNQAEISKDLELLKAKEDMEFSEDIEAIQQHQSEVSEELQELLQRLQNNVSIG